MSMPPRHRVVCFIDGSNLYGHLCRVYGGGKIHYATLCGILAGSGRKLVQWRYYAAPIPQGNTEEEKQKYARQQQFFEAIRRHRKGILRLARFERDQQGDLREKGVDVLLAVDLVRLAAENEYDVAIVLSGDGDLVPAIELTQDLYKKRVEVAMPDIPAYHIRQTADAFIEIAPDLFSRIEIR